MQQRQEQKRYMPWLALPKAPRHMQPSSTIFAMPAAGRGSTRITILIEPLNPYDAPGYFLRTAAQAEAIIRELGLPELRLMFDVYHQQITVGNICRNFEALLPIIGQCQRGHVLIMAKSIIASSCHTFRRLVGPGLSVRNTAPAARPERLSAG